MMVFPPPGARLQGDTLALGAPQKARAQRLGGDGGLFEGVSAFVYGSGTPSAWETLGSWVVGQQSSMGAAIRALSSPAHCCALRVGWSQLYNH